MTRASRIAMLLGVVVGVVAVATIARSRHIATRTTMASEMSPSKSTDAFNTTAPLDTEFTDTTNEEISGTVTAVNPSDRTVAIREEQGIGPIPSEASSTTQLLVHEDATILLGNQRLSFWDVHVGDQVKVQLQDDAGRRIVHNMIISQRAPGA